MWRALILLLLVLAGPALAEPVPYRLDASASRVGFTYTLEGAPAAGRLPILDAELIIDMTRLSGSRVAVRLDAARAQASLIFATEALTGPGVLDVANHPVIAFRSIAVRSTEWGALIDGEVTIRGVTRPMRLEARLFREVGREPRDYDRLQVRLTGSVDRHEFGASGFPGLVAPEIGIEITAWIDRAG